MLSKSIYRRNEELLIRLYAGEEGGEWRMMTFEKPRIDYLLEVNNEVSAIVLQSGLKIAVALPLSVLEQKIYQPEVCNDVLDLCELTGAAVTEVHLPNLEYFTPEHSTLKIRALLRRNHANDTQIFVFNENDIQSFERDVTSRAITGESVKVTFNARAKKPFDSSLAMIDMPYEDYARYLVEAKNKNLATLDLVDAFLRNPKRYGRNS